MEAVSFGPAQLVPAHDVPALELLHVLTAVIPNRLASTFMRALSGTVPFTEFGHLKRIRKSEGGNAKGCLEIILCVAPEEYQPPKLSLPLPPGFASSDDQGMPQPRHLEGLPEVVQHLVQEHNLSPTLVAVPRGAPQTREQWLEWCTLWPLSWRVPENPPLDKTITEQEQHYFSTHMMTALQMASSSGRACDNAAIFVDPLSGALVGQGVDGSSAHPLDHPVLMAIRSVAQRDWELWPEALPVGCSRAADQSALLLCEQNISSSAPLAEGERGSGQLKESCTLNDKVVEQNPVLSVPLGVGSEASGEAGPGASTDVPSSCAPGTITAGAPNINRKRNRTVTSAAYADASKRRSETGDVGSACVDGDGTSTSATSASPLSRGRPYMCTGYDCFVVREPCIMCAMALVHSRVQRVVYCQTDTELGVLGGSFKLHSQKSLNHHYKVYHLPKQEPGV